MWFFSTTLSVIIQSVSFLLQLWVFLHWISLRVIYMKQPKLVQFLLSNQFCQAVCPIFVSIWLTDITLHKIRRRDRKIPISKLVGEPGKIGQAAWQNRSDLTKIGSTAVRVNGVRLNVVALWNVMKQFQKKNFSLKARNIEWKRFFWKCWILSFFGINIIQPKIEFL